MRFFYLLICLLVLSACAHTEAGDGVSRWDFDHRVQYQLTQLTQSSYHLEVFTQLDTQFEQLATFMMRESYNVCGDYGFTIEVIKGVEGVNDRKSFPNLIQSSLVANINCR